MHRSQKSNSVGVVSVGVVMGSSSDWPIMEKAVEVLKDFGLSYEPEVVSAHRTPERLRSYALSAENCGIAVIIAGAGGAAHLPGMLAAFTHLPVLGVPIPSTELKGLDSLLSIVQMPAGIPLPTLAIGKAGACNAAYSAVSILALSNPTLREKLILARQRQTRLSMETRLPPSPPSTS